MTIPTVATTSMHNSNKYVSNSSGITTGVTHVNQYTVPYSQQSTTVDDKRAVIYATQSTSAIIGGGSGLQAPELSQDLCNAILQQQSDAKRGKSSSCHATDFY